jgi:hypothetical protein
MTHSLSNTAQRVLSPDVFCEVSQVRATPKLVPATAGVYGWWFSMAPSLVPLAGTTNRDGRKLLYVGIAPRAPGANGNVSKRSLTDRLKNHCQGPIGSSTLRRTLACLLADELALQIARRTSGKLFMPATDESKLTAWMDANAKVAWVITPRPWEVETELIRSGHKLPLNIRGSTDPFADTLKKLRASIIIS